MNVERFRQVADAIEKDTHRYYSGRDQRSHFTMKTFGDTFKLAQLLNGEIDPEDDCGTAGCIGGWCDALAMKESGTTRTVVPAHEWLGIECEDEAEMLFCPRFLTTGGYSYLAHEGANGHITADHAVKMLRYCADKGKVLAQYWNDCLKVAS